MNIKKYLPYWPKIRYKLYCARIDFCKRPFMVRLWRRIYRFQFKTFQRPRPVYRRWWKTNRQNKLHDLIRTTLDSLPRGHFNMVWKSPKEYNTIHKRFNNGSS